MKIAIVGGYGVFGSRLARLLVRDGHDVVVVGRNGVAATALAQEIKATALELNRNADLTPLWALALDAVVDAAGPFHAYGDDPYRLAAAAIAHGVNYMDLADDAAFCAGIATLDDAAKAAQVFALSGMSSVPALSSAAVADLATGTQHIALIETAILPGNRAPRGQAVVDSILHQAGTPIDITHDGEVDQIRSWSAAKVFTLPKRIRRRGYQIGVPDQSLFPSYFNARSVTFYAGLEVGLMNHGLAVFAWVRAKVRFGIPAWFSRLVRWAADWLHGLGSDEGGMVVRVVCQADGAWQTRVWRLLVRNGEGPFVPAVSARTVLRNPDLIRCGARAGLAEFPLDDAIAAMSDLASIVERETITTPTPLFPRVLGDAFDALPAAVQDSHQSRAPRRLQGTARITRGTGLWPRLIARIFGFPAAADDIPVTVLKTPKDGQEIWERRFGSTKFHSTLSQGPRGMQEQFGPFSFDLGLIVKDGALCFPVISGRFLGIPIPKVLLPQSDATETEVNGAFRFDVALKAPITGAMVVHYQGTLTPIKAPDPQ